MDWNYSTLLDIYRIATERYAARDCMYFKRDGAWQRRTFTDFKQEAEAARGGLASLGVKKGDRVAVISENCPPWMPAAFATFGLGAWWVPMYEAQLPAEWAFILSDCEASVVFVGSADVAKKLAPHLDKLPSVKHLVVLRGEAPSNAITFEQLLALGRDKPAPLTDVAPDDIATLIYTSGTTGKPKGVMLSHGNIASNVTSLLRTFPIDPNGERSLSFLPWAHAYGMVCEMFVGMASGSHSFLAQSPQTILNDLQDCKPTILFSVPRVWNKVYAGLHKRMDDEGGLKAKLFYRAIDVARRREELAAKKRRSLRLEVQFRILDKLVFSKVRAALGGRLKYAASGAAALSPEVARFLSYVGIVVCEGYGLTETSPASTNNRPGKGRIGTVGTTLPDVTVKIRAVADAPEGQGEIVVYGPNVMKGYYKRPEENAQVFLPDGGFRTGDLGFLDSEGFLHVTGRVKEQFKLENGKYVAPAPLEEQLKLSRYVSQVFVHGANRPHNVALVVPNAETVPEWAAKHGLTGKSLAELCYEPKLRALITDELNSYSSDFKSYERIKDFTLIPEEFSAQNGMLTQTLKIKRAVVVERYRSALDALYEVRAAA